MATFDTSLTHALSPTPKVALTIAGTDSGAGAGAAADLRTFAASGVFGVLVVTAVTAQNTVGIRQFLPMPAEMVAAQLDAVLEDLPVRVKVSPGRVKAEYSDAARVAHITGLPLIEVAARAETAYRTRAETQAASDELTPPPLGA